MAFDNTNRGSIWPNKKKRPDKQDADFTGSINVNGVEYWLNAWKRKEGASPDSPSLSFTVRPKDEQPRQATKAAPDRPDQTSSSRNADMDDDIPF
jgi:hypothetical protein